MAARQTLRRAGVSLALLATVPAFAQAAPAAEAAPEAAAPLPPIPDVIVTAERRADPAQRVPLALSVFSAGRLETLAATSSLGIGNYVPGLFASNSIGLGSANILTLRGLGNGATDTVTSPAVGTFIDDVYFGRPNGSNFGFFDVGRVEVLRGTQSTLYGRNTSGGAINVVLERPTDRVAGILEFGVGGYGRKQAAGSINLPFSEAVVIKLSGYLQDDSGYVHNTTTGERLNDSDMAGLRGAVQIRFNDAIRWNLAATYMRNDGENLANSLCDPNAPAVCKARYAATGRQKTQPLAAANPLIALGNAQDTQMYTSHIDWATDSFALSAITGFVNTRERFAIDRSDGRAYPTAAVPQPRPVAGAAGFDPVTADGRYEQFSQELRLTGSLLGGRIDYVAGLLYFDATDVTDRGAATARSGVIDKAAYVQADLNLSDRLKLTAGTRYTDEKTSFGISDNRAACRPVTPTCLDTANLLAGGVPITRTTRQWSPRFGASYQASDAVLAYASAARGWRSGGWDASGTTLAGIRPYAPETAWTYEGGIKATGFDGRVRANLAAFWVEAQQAQVPMLLGGVSVVQNIDGYRNRGAELEVTAVPLDRLTLRTAVTYQKDRYKVAGAGAAAAQQAACRGQLAAGRVPLAGTANTATNCAAGIIDANGNIAEPVRTPDFTVGVGAAYDWPIPAAGIILTPSVDALYRTAFEAGAANATLYTGAIGSLPANPFGGDVIGGSYNPAVWQVAAALSLRTDDGNWTLTVSCANCLDTAYTQSVVGTVGYLNPPRLWQIRARRAF